MKNLHPDKKAFWEEVIRCHNSNKKLVHRDKIGKTLANEVYIKILQDNLITQPTCVEFVTKKSVN